MTGLGTIDPLPPGRCIRMKDDGSRAKEDKIVCRALRIVEGRARAPGCPMGDPESCGAYFRLRLGNEEREHFEAAFLDSRNRLIATERLFSGTIDGAQVSPRIVAQRALALNATAVVLAHNHPSGHPEPSSADRAITAHLKDILQMLDVRLLDHFVVTADQAVSLAVRGLV